MKVKCLPKEQFLTDEQLKELSTEKLFHHFKMVRASESFVLNHYGHRCCEICHEYIGNDWENDVAVHARPYGEYKSRVKRELDSRPDQYSHRERKPKKNNKPKCVKRGRR